MKKMEIENLVTHSLLTDVSSTIELPGLIGKYGIIKRILSASESQVRIFFRFGVKFWLGNLVLPQNLLIYKIMKKPNS